MISTQYSCSVWLQLWIPTSSIKNPASCVKGCRGYVTCQAARRMECVPALHMVINNKVFQRSSYSIHVSICRNCLRITNNNFWFAYKQNRMETLNIYCRWQQHKVCGGRWGDDSVPGISPHKQKTASLPLSALCWCRCRMKSNWKKKSSISSSVVDGNTLVCALYSAKTENSAHICDAF